MTDTNNTELMQEAKKALAQARLKVITHPKMQFFGHMLCTTNISFSDQVPTMATNGFEVLVNPQFMLGRSVSDRAFILMHEMVHIIFRHVPRGSEYSTKVVDYDARRWNIAVDYVTNEHVYKLGFEVPHDAYHDTKYYGQTPEQIYAHLPDKLSINIAWDDLQPTKGGSAPSSGTGTQESESVDFPNSKGMSDAELEQSIKDRIVEAAQSAIMSGYSDTIPDPVQRMVDELYKPQKNWKKELRTYMSSPIKRGIDFKKRNKRYTHLGIRMPSKRVVNTLKEVTIACDTSGSVGQEEFTAQMSEVHAVLDNVLPKRINLIQFGSYVVANDKVKNTKELTQVKLVDGGGTDIAPVFEEAEKDDSKLLIIMTDGYFDMRKIPASYPKKVLWLIFNNENFNPRIGKVIQLPMEL